MRRETLPDLASLGKAAVDAACEPVEDGNHSYVYVRVRNPGARPVKTVVRVHCTPLATACAPAFWTLVDETPDLLAPAGGMAVAGPVVWPPQAEAGALGRFCFIASCGATTRSFPDPTAVDSAAAFVDWKVSHPQAHRNVVFEDVRPNGWAQLPFLMHGFGRLDEKFELEIDAAGLPNGRRVQIQLDPELPADEGWVTVRGFARLGDDRDGRFELHKARTAQLGEMRIPTRSRTARILLSVRLSEAAVPGRYYPLAAIQRWDGRELGRVTLHVRRRR